MKNIDLFVFAGEASGDLHGGKLICQLLNQKPDLKISAVAGPRMRELDISTFMKTERFHVIGFIDVFLALPKLIYYFFKIRNHILKTNPKAVIFIDYPEFNMHLQKSLKKKKYQGKLIHFICPTIWAWRKHRKTHLINNLDLLLTIFPFEKKLFQKTSLRVEYIGNPLLEQKEITKKTTDIDIGLFPGSRKKEIIRNLPYMLKASKMHLANNRNLKFGICISHEKYKDLILDICQKYPLGKSISFIWDKETLFNSISLAMATSGTITLELALKKIPTIAIYAIKKIDLFIAKNIFKINLPFYCIVNIIANRLIFAELYGPNLTTNALYAHLNKLLTNKVYYKKIKDDCSDVKNILENGTLKKPANLLLNTIFNN
jgi:lipid-A-disaccharide synthase